MASQTRIAFAAAVFIPVAFGAGWLVNDTSKAIAHNNLNAACAQSTEMCMDATKDAIEYAGNLGVMAGVFGSLVAGAIGCMIVIGGKPDQRRTEDPSFHIQ